MEGIQPDMPFTPASLQKYYNDTCRNDVIQHPMSLEDAELIISCLNGFRRTLFLDEENNLKSTYPLSEKADTAFGIEDESLEDVIDLFCDSVIDEKKAKYMSRYLFEMELSEKVLADPSVMKDSIRRDRNYISYASCTDVLKRGKPMVRITAVNCLTGKVSAKLTPEATYRLYASRYDKFVSKKRSEPDITR